MNLDYTKCILHDCRLVLHGKKKPHWVCLKCSSERVKKYNKKYQRQCERCKKIKQRQRFDGDDKICRLCSQPLIKCVQCGRLNKELFCKRCTRGKELKCPNCKGWFPVGLFHSVPGYCVTCAYTKSKNSNVVTKFTLRQRN